MSLIRNKGASGSPLGPKNVVFGPHPKASPPLAARGRHQPSASELPVSFGAIRGAGGQLNPITAARFVLVTTLVVSVMAPAALSARPFQNGDLFVSRSMKQDTGDRRLSFGANMQIAPVKALIKREVEKQVDKIAADNPEVKEVTEVLKDIDTEQLRALADSGELDNFKAMLKEEMKAQGKTMTPEQEQAIDAVDANKLKLLAEVVEIMNEPAEMLTFSLEPYATLNLSFMQMTAHVAIAGFNTDAGGTALQLGNVGLDLRFGDSYGDPGMAFGWSVGATGYGPTATKDAGMIALSNIMAAPRYFSEYATGAPYAMVGMDFAFLQVTLGGEYVHMVPVKDGSLQEQAWVHGSLGLLTYLKFIGISVEVDALFNVKNAEAMNQTVLLTGGLRFYLGFVHLGAAVQTPLVSPTAPDKGFDVGGVGTGQLADFNFLLNAQFNFSGEPEARPRLTEPNPAPLSRPIKIGD